MKTKILMQTFPFFLILICLLFSAVSLFAQQQIEQRDGQQETAAYEIEMLLQTNAVTYGQASRFILEASDIAVFTDTEEAFLYLVENKWLPKNIGSGQAARLDVLSGIFMKAFDIKGGLFYSLTRAPHYAYRELVYLNLIQGKIEPGMNVSGELLLFITGRILTQYQIGEAL